MDSTRSDNLAIFARLRGRRCAVIGGGSVAERKTRELVRAGARVTVLSPDVTAGLRDLERDGEIDWLEQAFSDQTLAGFWLIVAATDDKSLNEHVFEVAEATQTFCNVVDDPERCSFIMPAVVRRDPVTIAISSDGHAPVIARWVKGLIETLIPQQLGALATLAGRWRGRVRTAITDMDERRRFWESVLEGPIPDQVYAGRPAVAEAALEQALDRWHTASGARTGEAYIVGAGPGCPDLLTLRARQLLSQAEVVLYDRLVPAEILEFARRDAELISVGKRAGRPSIAQAQINRLLVEQVKRGKRVCRLKGGDPMIFGRGGEELEALAAAGLPFQVVPGVSAAIACAAYAGIPLTLRGVTQSVLLTTGHTESSADLDLGLLPSGQTLALYMGVARYPQIAEALLAAGNSPSLSIAIVERGTLPEQRVITTTLGELTEAAAELDIQSPALLLVGETTGLAEQYGWFAPERHVAYKGAQSQRRARPARAV
ncbi:MAG: siroheme synthase CysG [Gammaproteobacteria bacterium]|nr:siroheme synthase CysG [Gammaproteobacteria bacterium]MDH3507991.1 siroheme synthase CysG [Gammaproteobacteria bacterium]